MNIKYSFESVNMGDEFILVPVGDNAGLIQGVIKANETGNKIIQFFMQGLNEEQIINTLLKDCDNDRETITDYVRSVAAFLQDHHFTE